MFYDQKNFLELNKNCKYKLFDNIHIYFNNAADVIQKKTDCSIYYVLPSEGEINFVQLPLSNSVIQSTIDISLNPKLEKNLGLWDRIKYLHKLTTN